MHGPHFGVPPIPPNHHTTPEQAQDAELYESLQAAISESTALEESRQEAGHEHTPNTGAPLGSLSG